MPDLSDLSMEQQHAIKVAAGHLKDEFEGTFGIETIELFLTSSYEQFAGRATVPNFVPLLAERFARRSAPVVGVLALIGLAAYAVFVHDRDAFNYDGGLALVSVLAVALVWAATRPASSAGLSLNGFSQCQAAIRAGSCTM